MGQMEYIVKNISKMNMIFFFFVCLKIDHTAKDAHTKQPQLHIQWNHLGPLPHSFVSAFTTRKLTPEKLFYKLRQELIVI